MDLGADLDIAHQVEEVLRINFIQMVVDHLEVGVAYLEGEGEDEGDFQGVRHITQLMIIVVQCTVHVVPEVSYNAMYNN